MMSKLAAGLAIVAALATAAFVRPPRAAPAFSFAPPTVIPSGASAHVIPSGASAHVIPSGAKRSRGTRARRSHPRHPPRHHKRRRSQPPHDVDLNHADTATLARVPGINEGLARRIVAYRNLVGPFESLSDLDDLDGISASRLDTLARYLVVR